MTEWTAKDYQHMLFAQFLQLSGQLPEQVEIFFYLVRCGFRPYKAQKIGYESREYKLARAAMLYDKLKKGC